MINESNELFTKVLDHYLKAGKLKENLDIELAAEMLTTQTIYISRRLISDTSKSKQQVIDTMENMVSIIEGGILKS